MIDPAAWDGATAVLSAARSAVLVGHVHPDADALGSVLALSAALRHRGVPTVPTFPAPFEIPAVLRTLPGADTLVDPADVPAAPELLVVLDCSSPERLAGLADRLDAAAAVVVCDHHASNRGFGEHRLVDPDAAATGQLVAELIDRLEVRWDRDIAGCLYAAIASDTGSFRFESTTAAVHRLAARLLDVGVDHAAISRRLFDTHPEGWVPMLVAALGRARTEPAALAGAGLVWTAVTRADRVASGVPFDQAETVVGVLRTTEAADVAAVFKENEPGEWIVSTRSRGRVDVGALCTALGGGGHRLAAGYTAHGELADAVETLRRAGAGGR